MASTYVNDLRLNEMATGDASGSWGTVTNTNLELIGEAFSYGTETIGDADSTLTIADGAADAARSFYLKITSSVDLTTTRIVTLGPNTVSKVWMIENATTGSQVITIKQGSGATINVPNGQVKMISTDGAGSGGAVLDLLVDVDLTGTTTLVNLDVSGAVDIAGDLTLSAGGDGALRFTAASSVKVLDNNAAALVFEEADNAYMTFVTTDGSEAVKFDKALDINAATQIDATVTVGVDDTGYDVKFFGATAGAYMLWDESADDLILGGAAGLSVNSTALVTGVLTTTAATVFNGGFAANADSTLGTDKKVQFRDAAIYINSSVDGQLDIVADTEIQIAATTIDVNGALDVSGTALVTGVLTTTAATVHTGGITMPDNAKAIFGAGSDLEIYSDGTNIIIEGQNLDSEIQILSDDRVIIGSKAWGETFATFNDDGAVNLYYDGAVKLATTATGIDVTGAVSSNKGSAGTLATFTDGVNSNFVVETSSLLTTIGNGAGSTALAFKSNNTTNMTLDASGNVGIGTTSPATTMHIASSDSNGPVLRLENTNTTIGSDVDIGSIEFEGNDSSIGAAGITGKIRVEDDNGFGSSYKMVLSAGNASGGVMTLTDGLVINGVGIVTMPYQPAFSVNKGGTAQEDIAVGADVTITFDTERFDNNADFDLGANSFTAPVTGKYMLSLNIRLDNVDSAADYYIPMIITSNAIYRFIFDPDFGQDAAYWNVAFSVLADMDASDTAYVAYNQGGGTAQTDVSGDDDYTFFTGYLAC
jgi:hypothetical protein